MATEVMTFDDPDLETLADQGTMEYSRWPDVLGRAIPRLEHIVYNEFPIPSVPLPRPPSFSEDEDGPPEKKIKLADDDSTLAPPPKTLPSALLALVTSVRSTLQSTFPTTPPHTAQRLAELLLHPKQHYRTLPSYLRALDRIVSVASPASVFPLPHIQPNGTTTLLNGTSSEPSSPERGEDTDFIGGAELTEIPWLHNVEGVTINSHNGAASDLRTESTSVIDGPRGVGSVETVTVNVNGITPVASHTISGPKEDTSPQSLTQGELLRREQEAGVVPVPAPSNSGRVTRASSAASQAALRVTGVLPGDEEAVDSGDENVHAHGPGMIGMEDMGPQAPRSGPQMEIDVEGALGRRGEGEVVKLVEGDESSPGTLTGTEGIPETESTESVTVGEDVDVDHDEVS